MNVGGIIGAYVALARSLAGIGIAASADSPAAPAASAAAPAAGVAGERGAQVPDAAPRGGPAGQPGQAASRSLAGLRPPASSNAPAAGTLTAAVLTAVSSREPAREADGGQRAADPPHTGAVRPQGNGRPAGIPQADSRQAGLPQIDRFEVDRPQANQTQANQTQIDPPQADSPGPSRPHTGLPQNEDGRAVSADPPGEAAAKTRPRDGAARTGTPVGQPVDGADAADQDGNTLPSEAKIKPGQANPKPGNAIPPQAAATAPAADTATADNRPADTRPPGLPGQQAETPAQRHGGESSGTGAVNSKGAGPGATQGTAREPARAQQPEMTPRPEVASRPEVAPRPDTAARAEIAAQPDGSHRPERSPEPEQGSHRQGASPSPPGGGEPAATPDRAPERTGADTRLGAPAAQTAVPAGERVGFAAREAGAVLPGVLSDLQRAGFPDVAGLAPAQTGNAAMMEAVILNAAMIPGWPAPRPFEMPQRIARHQQQRAAPAPRADRPDNAPGRGDRDEAAVQTYLANMGVKRSLLARFRDALRPVHQRMRILFGLAVLATQVVFTLHTVLAELESIDGDADDIGREPGEQQRRLRG